MTSLNELTKETTAFGSWEQFEHAMSDNGYVPTLKPWRGRAKSTREFNEKITELRGRLTQMGYRVFPETI